MSQKFCAQTVDGHVMKVTAEIFQLNYKTSCFTIREDGIFSKMVDTHNPHRLMIDTELYSNNFHKYKYDCEDEFINIGVNSNHFHKLLKATKKKDTATLFIDNEADDLLGIRITPKDNSRLTTSKIKIQNIRNIEAEMPDDYGRPVIVASGEFQKAIKDMNNIGTTINITSGESYIRLRCNASGIYSRDVIFGEVDGDDPDSIDPDCEQNFDTEQLMRIIKISGLSSNIKIFSKNGRALLLETAVGQLGRMKIYIKSKEQIAEEKNL